MDLSKPVMETERLWLYPMDEQDQHWFFELNSDPEVMRYTGEDCFTSMEQSLSVLRERPMRDYREYGYGRWACVLKEGGEVIGWCGLKFLPELGETDIGYRFFKHFWGKGLGTEASKACVNFGLKELKLDSIIGIALEENVASISGAGKKRLAVSRA